MRKISQVAFVFLFFAKVSTFAALISISQTGGVVNNLWSAGNDSFQTRVFSTAPGSVSALDGRTFTVFDFVDDRPSQGARPFGLLAGEVENSFFRAGSAVNMASFAYTGATFLNGNLLQNNALNGTDNYVAFRFEGSDFQYYYGWLQFELNQLVSGQTAVRFIGGVIESNAGTSFNATSSVPEPSALSLVALGLGGLIAWNRRLKGNSFEHPVPRPV